MPDFVFAIPGYTVVGVCETDATEEIINDAVVADFLEGDRVAGVEYRIEQHPRLRYTLTAIEAPRGDAQE